MTVAVGTEAYAANLALGHLGQPEIADLADSNIRARAARQFFANTRDDLLRRKWWSFAKGWAVPSADAVASLGPLTTRYVMPTDCVRVRYLTDDEGEVWDDSAGTWDIESGQASIGGVSVEAVIIVTNMTAPRVAYTRRIEAVRLWDPTFMSVFTLELASRMSKRLARGSKQAGLHAEAEALLETAAGIDSKEQSRQKVAPATSWLAARRGYRSGWW